MTTTENTATADSGVDIHTRYPLDAGAAQRFEADGFVRLSGVLSRATLEHYEPEITSKVIELNTMHLPIEERTTYDKAFLQVENLWRYSDTVRDFVFSRRLARIAAELMGVRGVRLYHDQALYKEPSGGITPWHADQYYWPLSSDRSCTVWVPLQDTPADMGPLEFAAGSQRFEFGRDLPISDESEAALQTALGRQGFEISRRPYSLGDVSFHQGWTFHHAGPNRSTSARRVMTIIYIDADMTVSPPTNDNQQADLDAWMPGARPGEVPETHLNPLLWPNGHSH